MPSGPKKRKTAKKETIGLNPSSHTHGDDDLELHESKECDNGGGVLSQDHLVQLSEDENGTGEKSEVGGLQSNENNLQDLGDEEVRNIPVDIENAIIKENGRSGHEQDGTSLDEEDHGDGFIPVESQDRVGDTIAKENGRCEHEEIDRDIDEVDQCNDVYSVEGQDKIEDMANKENERTAHEETGQIFYLEDQSNCVNGAIGEEDVSLVDPVISVVRIVPTEYEIHDEDEPHTEEGKSHHHISSSDGAKDEPCEIKHTPPEEDAVHVESVNGDTGEAPIEMELYNENNSNEEFENEGTASSAESHLSAIEGNQTPEVIYRVDSEKTTITSLAGQANSSVDQESGNSVAENFPLVVSEKTLLHLAGKEEGTSHPDLLMEHVIEETAERIVTFMDDKVDAFEMVKDVAILPEEMSLKHVETTPATDSNDIIVDGPLVHSKNISIISADNEAEHHGDLGATTYEPMLITSPGGLQKTSWKGCCGLFEAFKRSG